MDERKSSVEERLGLLERKCRRLRTWCVGVTSLLVLACAAAAVSPDTDVVRARRFEAVDGEGRTTAVLSGAFEDGPPGAGVRIGDFGHDSFAMFQLFPVVDEETGEKYEAISLQMNIEHAGESSHFSADVWPGMASNEVANHRRAIVSYVEPEESSFKVETRCEPETRDCHQTLLEILTEDDVVGLVAFKPGMGNGVLFELPQPSVQGK